MTFLSQRKANITANSPGGYIITHLFQCQDGDDNDGQYTLTTEVSWWEDALRIAEQMMQFPEASGFTISLTIQAKNQEAQ